MQTMPSLRIPITPYGAVVSVKIRPGPAQVTALQAAGKPVPAETTVNGFLDTGATFVCLNSGWVATIGMKSANGCAGGALGTGGQVSDTKYDVEIALDHDGQTSPWVRLDACGLPMGHGMCMAALGRDFLDHFRFEYDGPGRQAVLSW
jgi:hypothetical protein